MRFRWSHSPSNRPDRADRPIAGFSLSARMTWEIGEITRFVHGNGANIPASPYGLGDLERMEHAKLAKGSEHKLPIGHSPSSARKKADPTKAEPTPPHGKETDNKSKPEKMVCRYCGSDDLAPSFIKRRDRRCRKCFGKRYGSTAGARKARVRTPSSVQRSFALEPRRPGVSVPS